MGKIWIATEFFYPEETTTSFILSKIANKLISKYEIHVICGSSSTPLDNNTNNFKINERIKISRIKEFNFNKNNLFFRFLKFFILSCRIFLKLCWNVKKNEKVFIVTNPAPLLILVSLLKKIKKIELIVLVHDVFPENTLSAKIFKNANSPIYKCVLKIFHKAYNSADKLFVIGRDMEEVIKSKLNKTETNIQVIESWSENEILRPYFLSPKNDKIVFLFAGNIGRVQGLEGLFNVIKNCNSEILEFHFIGDGALKQYLEDFVENNKLTNVYFGNAFRRIEQEKIINGCDVAIVSMSFGMYGLGVPSKTYNILACGKPILYIGDHSSEIDLLVKEHNLGYSFNSYDDLLNFFNNLKLDDKIIFNDMGQYAHKLANTRYSEDYILKEFLDKI